MIGIYKITNPFNQSYIGQSVDIEKRFRSHKKGLNSNFHLQLSFRKHGIENHTFEVLEICDKEELFTKEKHFICLHKENTVLFNNSIYFISDDEESFINSPLYFFEKQIKITKTIQEIKHIYKMLKDKKPMCIELSKEVGIKPSSIYGSWFGSLSIPEKHQELVLTKLKEKQL